MKLAVTGILIVAFFLVFSVFLLEEIKEAETKRHESNVAESARYDASLADPEETEEALRQFDERMRLARTAE